MPSGESCNFCFLLTPKTMLTEDKWGVSDRLAEAFPMEQELTSEEADVDSASPRGEVIKDGCLCAVWSGYVAITTFKYDEFEESVEIRTIGLAN